VKEVSYPRSLHGDEDLDATNDLLYSYEYVEETILVVKPNHPGGRGRMAAIKVVRGPGSLRGYNNRSKISIARSQSSVRGFFPVGSGNLERAGNGDA
jgi:hypothetical protein